MATKPIYVRERRATPRWMEPGSILPEPRSYDRHELYFTLHAREVLERRNITPDTVWDIMRSPDIIEPNDGRLRFVGYGLAVVLGSKKHQFNNWPIITVLLRDGNQWTDKDARER